MLALAYEPPDELPAMRALKPDRPELSGMDILERGKGFERSNLGGHAYPLGPTGICNAGIP